MIRGRFQVVGLLGTGVQGAALEVRDSLADDQLRVMKIFGLGESRYALDAFDLLTQLASPYLPALESFFVVNRADRMAVEQEMLRAGLPPQDIEVGRACLIRHKVEGVSADVWVLGRSVTERLRLLWQVASSLEEIHRAGYLHGDLKPAHILVDRDGVPTLIDFGLSRPVGRPDRGGGSPHFMAPEIFLGKTPTTASERYTLGALAYQLLTDRPPYPAETLEVLVKSHLEHPIPELGDTVPAREATLVRLLLEKRPEDRPRLEEVTEILRPRGARSPSRVALPFVGRDEAKEEALAALVAGRSTRISGASGAGKSRLLRHVRWHAEARGWTTLQAPPGQLSLEEKVAAIGCQLAGLSGRVIARLPQVEGDRLRQLRALQEWLDAMVPEGPILLFWDDAELLPDHERFLSEYVRQGGRMPFLAAVGQSSALSGQSEVALPPLSVDALAVCLDRVGVALKLTEAARQRAIRASEGNPRALQLAIADVVAGRRQGRDDVGSDAERDSDLPVGTSSMPHLELLAVLERCPEPISARLLATAMQWTTDAVHEAAHQLASSGQAVHIENGLARARPLSSLSVATGKLASWLRRLGEALTLEDRPGAAAVVATLGGDLSAQTVRTATKALLERDRRHFALHLTGAAVASGAFAWLEDLVSLSSEVGEVEAALSYLPESDGPALELSRARLLYNLGRLDESAEVLEALRKQERTPTELAEWAALSAWVALRQGRHRDAMALADEQIAEGDEVAPKVAAELAAATAAAATLSGDALANAQIRSAEKFLERAEGVAPLKARLLTFQAIAATHRGDLTNAKALYERALEVAQSAGLDAHLPTFLLNAGTAHDHLGDLGLARERYRRGSELAGAHVALSTRVLLAANQANIALRLGRFDEVRELLDDAMALCGQNPQDRAGRYVLQLRAESAIRLGDVERAAEMLDRLTEQYRASGDKNGLAEAALLAARAAIGAHKPLKAKRSLDEAIELVETHDFNDLRALALVVSGEYLDLSGARAEALAQWRAAIALASRTGDLFRVIDAARFHLRAELLDPSDRHLVETAVRQVIEGLGASLQRDYLAELPESLRGVRIGDTVPAQAEKPIGALSAQSSESQLSEMIQTGGEEQLYRLLGFTAKLARQTNYRRFLKAAIDMAIDLASAERGFLLLRENGEFRVAVSRDVDGEPIRRPILKVSLTIAERVAEQDAPLTTVDARQDGRFELAKSIHQLSLTSILCLPIRIHGEVIGVVYLDHRFRAGAFGPEVQRLLMAFADQLAVALHHIDRVRTLERRNDELETARTRVEELLAEKAGLAKSLQDRCDDLELNLKTQQQTAPLRFRYEDIVAGTPSMTRVLEKVDRLVDSNIPVLISGETGTGKELIARAIHYNGPRQSHLFMPINCGAMPENLIESELFGHVKGAFTGADRDKVGLFVAADGGSIFLDEVGELPPMSQVKLLRVLQEKTLRPVGGVDDLTVDVRVIAATNRNLLEMVDDESFRADLFYRLAGVELALPPLRNRRDDIPLLVRHFMREFQADAEDPIPISPRAMKMLYEFDWPGNVRQLNNVLQVSLAMCDGKLVRAENVKPLLRIGVRAAAPAPTSRRRRRRGPRPKVLREEVVQALREVGGDVKKAAQMLSVTPRSVYRYMMRWEIDFE